jgi:NAD(P)-dependent dehydrogenase (short-subunit alcohol dehydrogenase family)
MKIVVIGAGGVIGKAVVAELSRRHQIIPVGRKGGQYQADIADAASLRKLFETVGTVDAAIAVAGNVHFGPFGDMTSEQFKIGLHDKLLGQVQLAMIATNHLADRGSITLTSGLLSRDPIAYGVNASTVNGAVDSFVRSAALEMPRGIRINVVSPGVVVESLPVYGPYFRGWNAVPAARVALAYSRSVEGAQTGQVHEVPG